MLQPSCAKTVRLATVGVVAGVLAIAGDAAAANLDLEAPFRVNTVFKNSQSFPAVAMNAAGASVVVWRNFAGEPEIRAQRFNSAGVAIGPELGVNTYTDGVQDHPDVAIDDAGRFVVVWESFGQDGSSYGVYAQRYGTAGQKLGGELRVNVTTLDRQRSPAVAMASDGRFVVVWQAKPAGPLDVIMARRYAADGSPASGELPVNTKTNGLTGSPAVAMAADGRFAVAWETTAYPTGGGSDIAMRRFGANGTALGNEVLVNTTTQQTQDSPAIAMAASGVVEVAWESFLQDGSDQGIFAQRFAAGGGKLGGEVQVNSFTAGIQNAASVAILADGTALVVWRDVERDAIYARSLDTAGAPSGGERLIDQDVSGDAEVAADADGDFFVVWQNTGPDVYGRFGAPLGGGCTQSAYALCLNGGRFQVETAWRTATGSGSGRRIDLSGDTGAFWFFNGANVELLVKLLTGCSVNGYRWVFSAGLTTVEVDLAVREVATGDVLVFHNPLDRRYDAVQQTQAFACNALRAPSTAPEDEPSVAPWRAERGVELAGSAFADPRAPRAALAAPAAVAGERSAAAGTCQATPGALCLRNHRFRVQAAFQTGSGGSGNGIGYPLTDDSGVMWFFNEGNLELVFKVLDGCSINGHFWVFSAGLTNVGVTLTVTDTGNGDRKKQYVNPVGKKFELVTDTGAFSCD